MLTFRSSPDYEDPADANTDNVYEVTVVADYGTDSAMLDVSVTVTDVDEEGPVDLVDRYDTDGVAGIQKSELLIAVGDYFDDKITKIELLGLIAAYFG